MERQPTLEGERVILRPTREADRDELSAIASDPGIWEQHPIHDRWRTDAFAEFFDEAVGEGRALTVIDRSTGAIIGTTRFQKSRPEDETSVEIGSTFLARRCWGKGFNLEMKRLMLAYALEHVARVDFRVGETNYRARIALENIGATRTRRTDLDRYQGKRVLYLYYAITAQQFAQGPLIANG